MKELTVKIKVEDDIEAYRVVSRLSFKFEVSEASYSGKVYGFDKETKSPKHFLRDDFNKKQ